MQLTSEVLLLAVAALMLAQSIASMRAAQRLLILGSLLSDMVKSASKDGADTPSGRYGGLREDDLSIHLGVEMIFNGAKEAWPADSMSSLAFGNLVADWIVNSGRQDLTLEEVCESIKRGDHKSADGQPYRPL